MAELSDAFQRHKLSQNYHGMSFLKHVGPSFDGCHNQMRVTLYIAFWIYYLVVKERHRRAHGLTSTELVYITGLKLTQIAQVLEKEREAHHLDCSAHYGGHCTRTYFYTPFIEQYIRNWGERIPWERWGLDDQGRRLMLKRLEHVLDRRGYC